MPEAYDQEGVVNQEKRFAAAMQRYRSVVKSFTIVSLVGAYIQLMSCEFFLFLPCIFIFSFFVFLIQGQWSK